MDDRIKKWLFDALSSIEEIDSYNITSTGYDSFSNDIKTIRAVERNIEIIGEALNRINKELE